MTESINAIVLAGDREASRNFACRNKTLLEVAGKPILERVLDTLDRVERIVGIVVIGPSVEIDELVGNKIRAGHWRTSIEVIEQKEKLLENAWSAYCHVIGEDLPLGCRPSDSSKIDIPAFFIAGDLPLVTPKEVDEFLDGSFAADADFCSGVTEETNMTRFSPTDDKPGIRMTYLHLACGSYRLNNMHFARPFRVGKLTYFQRLYQARYQRQMRNILKIIADIFSTKGLGLRPVIFYLLLQLCTFFRSLKLGFLLGWTRRRLTRERVSDIASILLQARAAMVETRICGAAVDVDNGKDYETICLRFEEWAGRKGPVAEPEKRADPARKSG